MTQPSTITYTGKDAGEVLVAAIERLRFQCVEAINLIPRDGSWNGTLRNLESELSRIEDTLDGAKENAEFWRRQR